MNKIRNLHTRARPHHFYQFSILLQLVAVFVIFTSPASAVVRFTNRSLFVFDATPSATTKYQITFTYTTATSVGSVDMLFCENPIPDVPCVPPPGLDVSNAVLSSQNGVTGYSISQQSTNHIVLSRTPGAIGSVQSSYELSNVVNPSSTSHSFAVRLSDYASNNATGPIIDLGSVLSSVGNGVVIAAQVPPMMVFCVAHQVDMGCSSTNGGNYSDMGSLSPNKTLTATSQMAAGTNASAGYSITVYGTTMAAGTSVINNVKNPSASIRGSNQFGLNLVSNTLPNVGNDPDGPFTNANPAPKYSTPNHFSFKSGDVVAGSPNVALMRRYTVSYIVNTVPDLRAGVYTTTLTYICSGRF